MGNKLSLYKLITGEFRDLLSVSTVDMMNTISHQIEDVVMNNNLTVDFYAGFQRISYFHAQRPRYERLARAARRVYVFGIPDDNAPEISGVEYIPLQPDDALALEWFLVINTPYFHVALLTKEVEGRDAITGGRQFEGVWTFDERIVSQAYLVLSQFLGQEYTPVFDRDYDSQSRYVADIASNLVTRLELNNVAFKQSERLSNTLSNVAQAMALNHTTHELFDVTTIQLQRNLQARTVTIWQLDSINNEIELMAGSGIPSQVNDNRQPVGSLKSLASQAAKSEQVEYVQNAVSRGIVDLFDTLAASILAVPLISNGKLVGVLQMTDSRSYAYNDSTIKSIKALGAYLGAALQGGSSTSLPAPTSNKALPAPTNGQKLVEWTVLNSTLDGVISLNADKTIQFVNGAARQQLAINGQDMAGLHISALKMPELVQFVNSLDPNDEIYPQQINSAQDKPLMVNASPIYSGTDNGYSLSDVTAWTVVLREESASQAQLGPMAEKMMVQTAIADDLMSRIKSMGKLVSMIPTLGNMMPTQAEALNRITQINDEMTEMVQQLSIVETGAMTNGNSSSDAAVPTTGKLALLETIEAHPGNRAEVEIKSLLEAVVSDFTEMAIGKKIDMQLEITQNLPLIKADAKQLYHAITELVDNAIKYNPEGIQIRVIAGLSGQTVIVAVRDSGPGIWPKDVPLLFNRFHRLNNEATQAVEGQGLGLSIVKAVAQNHNGRALVESRVERGSIFLLKLPL